MFFTSTDFIREGEFWFNPGLISQFFEFASSFGRKLFHGYAMIFRYLSGEWIEESFKLVLIADRLQLVTNAKV